MTEGGDEAPAPLLQALSFSVRQLDDHDLHLVIVISPVEEGDAGVAAQAWALLGVLDLSQQLHNLLCGGVLRGGSQAWQGLSLSRLHVVGKAHLVEIFGEREAGL